jgi:hypothetical protein
MSTPRSVPRDIIERQAGEGWGAGAVDRFSRDMRAEFPGQDGWSRRNAMWMRKVAALWPDEADFAHHVVVELKVGRLQPVFVVQLAAYVGLVDARLRDLAKHAPTIGILLCTSKNEAVVRHIHPGEHGQRCRCRRL